MFFVIITLREWFYSQLHETLHLSNYDRNFNITRSAVNILKTPTNRKQVNTKISKSLIQYLLFEIEDSII